MMKEFVVIALLAYVTNPVIFAVKVTSAVYGGGSPGSTLSTGNEHFIENNGEFPYTACVEYIYGQCLCTAVIIKRNFVLTAAHCLVYKPSLLAVRAGTYLKNDKKSKFTQVIPVAKVFIHELFQRKTHEYDVAILKLNHTFKINAAVNTINLPSEKLRKKFVNKRLIVLGFGTRSNTKPTVFLQSAKVKVIKNDQCYKSVAALQKCHMCTIGDKATVGVTHGDSGGPLVQHFDGKPYKDVLVGISCFAMKTSTGLLDPSLPSVYTEVAPIRKWIDSVINAK